MHCFVSELTASIIRFRRNVFGLNQISRRRIFEPMKQRRVSSTMLCDCGREKERIEIRSETKGKRVGERGRKR